MLRRGILKLALALGALCSLGQPAGTAAAMTSNQAAAFAVVPFRVMAGQGSVQWSYAAVTNASPQHVTLHLNFIDGANWNGQDYSCPVTAQETVLFTFRPLAGGGMAADFKCSFAVPTANGVVASSTPTTLSIPFQRGIMTIAIESPPGVTSSANLLFADWLVVDFVTADVYGAEAVSFQGLSALSQDGDRNYRFDGKEYSMFPAQLLSGFIAPDAAGTISGELILFTLDATVGGQPVAPGGQVDPVQLRGNVYNDRENAQSISFAFDCFTIVDLLDVSPAFQLGGFMSTAGHFELTPAPTGAGDPAHEHNFGNGDRTRKRPAMGWIVQHLAAGAQIPAVAPPNGAASPLFAGPGGAGSFARALSTSTTSFAPLVGETPTFSSN